MLFNLPLKERPCEKKNYAVQVCGQNPPEKRENDVECGTRTSSHPQRVTVHKDTSADSPYAYTD
jgi:hypothetical protein